MFRINDDDTEIYRGGLIIFREKKQMKRIISFLTVAFLAVPAAGILKASDFETDLNKIADQAAVIDANPALPAPLPAKWWSMMGSAHLAIMQASLNFINKTKFTDIERAKGNLITGTDDESGHPNKSANGGPVKEIWFGTTTASNGGVLYNYEQFQYAAAYEKLGVICHLTQDQAVPTHAANISHGVSDTFEAWDSGDNRVAISASRDNGEREPYAYYQAVQDETRSNLPQWVSPLTGRPYWVAANDAPPLGQDVTYGPSGHYGGAGNSDLWAYVPQRSVGSYIINRQRVTASPEIRFRQLAVAGAATVALLESASKRLPPLVAGLSVTPKAVRAGEAVSIQFTALDNRSRKVAYKINVYRDGVLLGIATRGTTTLNNPNSGDIMLSAPYTVIWHGVIKGKPLAPGNYVLDVRLTDGDGNTTPDEVNTDSNPANDTRAALTIN